MQGSQIDRWSDAITESTVRFGARDASARSSHPGLVSIYLTNNALPPTYDCVEVAIQPMTLLFVRYAVVNTLHIILFRAGAIVTASEHLYDLWRLGLIFFDITNACSNAYQRREEDSYIGQIHSLTIRITVV